METDKLKDKVNEKSFTESKITLQNRKKLEINGVEKIYETNNNKIQLKVTGSNFIICGGDLNISKFDLESGLVNIDGFINEMKFVQNSGKGGLIKKIFK